MAVLPDELIWEILTWLPVKSLMRFKTVSKLWLSTILDPAFAQAHREPAQGLLLMDEDALPVDFCTQLTRNFFCVNLDDAYCNGSHSNPSVDVSNQFPVPEDLCSFMTTNLANGLLCFYKSNVTELCNIATRQRIRLPESKHSHMNSTYHLGFDPINKSFKLLKMICPISEEEEDCQQVIYGGSISLVECEILTLGVDSSWRSIAPPACQITSVRRCLCSNGVLYCIAASYSPRSQYTELLVMAFNLATEKFKLIHEWPGKPHHRMWKLIGPTPTLVSSRTSFVSYDPIVYGHTIVETTHYHEETGSWSEMQKFTLPYAIDICFKPFGALPNGMLVICNTYGFGHSWYPMSVLYLFDQIKGNLQKIVLRNPPVFPPFGLGTVSWYKENVISLRQLTDCR